MSSLRLIPSASHPTTTTSSHPTAASAPGLPDPLRQTLTPNSPNNPPTPSSTHPLETRLLHWRSTQDSLKLSLLRRTFGIAEPVRRGMELSIVQAGDWRPSVLGAPARVHDDILSGRDTELGWEDVYARDGGEGMGEGVQGEMEARVGMGRW